MNLKTAKSLRRKAKENLYKWYLSLLPEDQQSDLTPELALLYTPKVQYWKQTHNCTDRKTGKPYTAQQHHVSEGTLRWFILQEKQRHVRRNLPTHANGICIS